MSKEAEDYKGPRTAKAIVEQVSSLLSDVHVERPASQEELKQFLDAGSETTKVPPHPGQPTIYISYACTAPGGG